MTATLAVQNTGEAAVFWICGALAVLGALGMLFSRKAVHSALFLAMTMINLAILYVSLSAPFLGMVQVIVYTGAIMMLFLFVLMVVGVDSSDSLIETVKGQRPAAILFGLGFAVLLLGLLGSGHLRHAGRFPGRGQRGGAAATCRASRELIFTQYVFAFEVTSALLITAALGAMILTHREHVGPEADAARPVRGALPQRAPEPAAATGQLRPAQRGRHPGAAAGRIGCRDLRAPADGPAALRGRPCRRRGGGRGRAPARRRRRRAAAGQADDTGEER